MKAFIASTRFLTDILNFQNKTIPKINKHVFFHRNLFLVLFQTLCYSLQRVLKAVLYETAFLLDLAFLLDDPDALLGIPRACF